MKRIVFLAAAALILQACGGESPSNQTAASNYLDYSGRDDVLSGGVKMIPVDTPKGTFRVWTKRMAITRP